MSIKPHQTERLYSAETAETVEDNYHVRIEIFSRDRRIGLGYTTCIEV